MSMGRLNRIRKTRQNVLKCRHVDEYFQAFSLRSRVCCLTPNISLLVCRANLSYDDDEGRGSSSASATFLEEVPQFPVLSRKSFPFTDARAANDVTLLSKCAIDADWQKRGACISQRGREKILQVHISV